MPFFSHIPPPIFNFHLSNKSIQSKFKTNSKMSSPAEIVAEQRKFFKIGETRCLNFRKEQLNKMRQMIDANREKIVHAVYKDLRLNPVVTMEMEVNGPLATIDYSLAHMDEWAKPEKIDPNELGEPVIMYEPKGVVLVIGAWNCPASLVFQPTTEAIAAGNTVLIKPSEVSAHTSALLKQLLDATFEKKFVAVIEGDAEETQRILNERFDHIFYTGNSTVAKQIMQAAAKTLTPVTLELGGKCPVVVENDADVAKAAQRIAKGKWLNCGQTCIAPDYVMCSAELKPKLIGALEKSIKILYGDNPKVHPSYSRMVNRRHFDRVKAMFDKTQGKVLIKAGEHDREDVFIPPMVIEVDFDDALMHEELFGPVLPILTVEGLDEAIGVINDGEKPLAAYLFTQDQKKVDKFLNCTSSGGVTINDTLKHIFVIELPFGGVGHSGMGKCHGKYGFVQLSHAKAVLKRSD